MLPRDLPPGARCPSSGVARHERAQPSPHFDGPFVLERAVGVLDRVRVDLQVRSEIRIAGNDSPDFSTPDRHAALNLVGNLPENRPRVGPCPR